SAFELRTPAQVRSDIGAAPASHTHSPADVGLGNVQNYGIATQAEAEAGTANNKYMTPLRVAQAIAALHANRRDNPHNVQAPQVPYSSGVSGFTPANVKAALDALADVRIVEMGSNSNGEYVRWENGLQVCWTSISEPSQRHPNALGPIYRSSDIAWTYPASFVSQPTVVAGGGNAAWASPRGVGTLAAQLRSYSTDKDLLVILRPVAIGRWK